MDVFFPSFELRFIEFVQETGIGFSVFPRQQKLGPGISVTPPNTPIFV